MAVNTTHAVGALLSQLPLDDQQPWALLFDLDQLQSRYQRLASAFPPDTLHAVALKANPLVAVARRLMSWGAGLEAASAGELAVAEAAGCPPQMVVFDSPAKTDRELARALAQGHWINADSLEEIERIAALGPPDTARVGLRINPEVGPGAIDTTSVATLGSKFGCSLSTRRLEITAAFARHPWLLGLHVHTGSQGMGTDLMVEGIRRVWELARELPRPLQALDIGGGLPVAYQPGAPVPEIEDYARALQQTLPSPWAGPTRLITEFGRWLHAPCGLAVSRVVSVKPSATSTIAVVHFGADLLLRRAYQPEKWFHRLELFDAQGAPVDRPLTRVTVAGPLCFAGDVLARDLEMPRPQVGDLLVAHDVGAYTFSMWSRYCSRRFPPIYGREGSGPLELLRSGETDEEVAGFWS